MLSRSRLAELAAACALCCGFAARAEEAIYGPDGAPTVVQHKLHTMTGRWEAGVAFSAALNTALVDQYGGYLEISYHPNEWLDFGVQGLYNATSLSTLSENVRADLCRTPPNCRSSSPPKDEFTNDNQLRYGGFALARLAPIYGKVNLFSELAVHFQAYLLAGGGVAGIHRESINLCAQPGTAACTEYQTSDDLKPAGEFGGGFRFYIGERWSLRTEIRGYLFGSSYKAANDLTVPSSGTPQSYIAIITTFDAGVFLVF
jgi:outer membrane beta-barrel protein